MAITRRQFAYGALASLFSRDPLKAASEVLEKATSPGWFSSPDIDAAVLDVGYGKERYTKAYGAAGTPERVFIIAATCNVPLLFKPGSALSYSNLGVLVLKESMERSTSVPLKQFLKTEVFE